MQTENYKSIIVDETELAKRLECTWLKGCKLFNQNIRTEANKQIMIDKNGNVIGAKISKKDEIPGVFLDKYNGYKYIRLHNGGPIALHIAMKFVFFDEIYCPFNNPTDNFVVDHINQCKQDNRLSNLRLVSKQFNSHNHERCKGNVNSIPTDSKLIINEETNFKCYSDDENCYIELSPILYFKQSINDKIPKWLIK